MHAMMLRVRLRLHNFPVELRAELLAPVKDAVKGVPLDTHVYQCRRPVPQLHHLNSIHRGRCACYSRSKSKYRWAGRLRYWISRPTLPHCREVGARPLLVLQTCSHTRWPRRDGSAVFACSVALYPCCRDECGG